MVAGFKTIRPYVPEDADTVLDIWYRASIDSHGFVPDSFWAGQMSVIRDQYLTTAKTYVYLDPAAGPDGNRPVRGFLSLLEPNQVGGLFVAPEFQGRGAGRALVEFAAWLRGDITLYVFVENENAVAFYRHMGFVVVNESVHEPTGHMQYLMLRVDTGRN